MGLYHYKLARMDSLAYLSHPYYHTNPKGGEGHMEVGKLIANNKYKKVNMTISVKPFGCMPSSGVSDGVQSLITELYPDGIFLPLETSGDGAVNFYSRIQMQLFKAKQMAQAEVEQLKAHHQLDDNAVNALAQRRPELNHSLHRSPLDGVTTTAAATLSEMLMPPVSWWRGMLDRFTPASALAKGYSERSPQYKQEQGKEVEAVRWIE